MTQTIDLKNGVIDPLYLSAIISSRICHDLVNSISGIDNALGFMSEPEGSDMRGHADQLLQSSAKAAMARVQFFRFAFGSMGISDGAADLHQVRSLIERFFETANRTPTAGFDIEVEHLSYRHARLLMNLAMLGALSLPRGGMAELRLRSEAGGMTMVMTARDPSAKLKDDAVAALQLDGGEEGFSVRVAQPLFTRLLADELGGDISVARKEGEVIVMVTGVQGAPASD